MNLILEKHRENPCGWCLSSVVVMVPGEGREWLVRADFASISLKLSQNIKYSSRISIKHITTHEYVLFPP